MAMLIPSTLPPTGRMMPQSSSMGTFSFSNHIYTQVSCAANTNSSEHALSYIPALSLAILAILLYACALVLHLFRLYQTRLYAFSILCTATALFELVGYAFRLRSTRPPIGNPYDVISFVVQYFFIVVAPVFLSAAIYTTLTSLIAVLGQNLSPLGLSRRSILAIFIISDVVATLTQVAGAGLIGAAQSNRKDPTTPNNILLGGLVFQCVTFLVFLVLLGLFFLRARKVMTSTGHGGLMQFSWALVAGSILIYLRTIFRMAETATGFNSYVNTHEAFFGLLEFAPIVCAILILGWWHPGVWVPRTSPSRRGESEMETVENVA